MIEDIGETPKDLRRPELQKYLTDSTLAIQRMNFEVCTVYAVFDMVILVVAITNTLRGKHVDAI